MLSAWQICYMRFKLKVIENECYLFGKLISIDILENVANRFHSLWWLARIHLKTKMKHAGVTMSVFWEHNWVCWGDAGKWNRLLTIRWTGPSILTLWERKEIGCLDQHKHWTVTDTLFHSFIKQYSQIKLHRHQWNSHTTAWLQVCQIFSAQSCDSENVQIKLMNYKNTKRTISKATCYFIQSMCKIIQPINNKSTVGEKTGERQTNGERQILVSAEANKISSAAQSEITIQGMAC